MRKTIRAAVASLSLLSFPAPFLLSCGSPPKTVVAQGPNDKIEDDGPEPLSAAIEYESGEVLKYVPSSCDGGYGYLHLTALMRNEAVASNMATIQRKLLEKINSGKEADKAGRALDALKEKGVDLVRDPREIVLCKHEGTLTMLAGGNFSGKDVLGAFSSANVAAGEGALARKKVDGVWMLRLKKKGALARLAPNVLAVGDDVLALAALKNAPNGGAAWNVSTGQLLVAHMTDKREEKMDLRVSESGTDLQLWFAMELTGKAAVGVKSDPKEFKKRMHKELDKQADKIEKGPLKSLAPTLRKMTIDVSGATVVFTTIIHAADLSAAIQSAAGSTAEDLGTSF